VRKRERERERERGAHKEGKGSFASSTEQHRISGFVVAHVGGNNRSNCNGAVTAWSGGNAAVGR
jgi:hypothetical protein